MRKPGLLNARGFTLIELMIVVAIVAILAAVALPSYRDYLMRGYVVDATTLLSSYQAQMERYYQDNRTYIATGTGSNAVTPPCATGTTTQRTQGNFTLTCTTTDGPPQAYVLTATGSGPVASFVYTVNQTGTRASTFPSTASGWNSSTTCWVTKKGQTC